MRIIIFGGIAAAILAMLLIVAGAKRCLSGCIALVAAAAVGFGVMMATDIVYKNHDTAILYGGIAAVVLFPVFWWQLQRLFFSKN